MNIQLFFTLYFISIPIFFIVDMIWLGFVAKSFYQTKLGHLLGLINWLAVILFYLVFLLGLTYFATYPTVTRGVLATGVVLGALFGFFTYATYDLTNQATMRDWPISVTLVDIIWGTFLGALVTAITYIIYSKFF